MKRIIALVFLCIMMMSTLSGCYWMSKVSGQQVGLVMSDGVSITEVVPPGRYTKMGIYSSLTKLDISTKTSAWMDSDVWTKDKQVVQFGVSISYARKSDTEAVRVMWTTYNLEARDDVALDKLVMSRLPRVVKQVTTTYTLDQMLGIDEASTKNRDTLQADIFNELRNVLGDCSVELIDIGINNIGVDESYAQKLKEKATAKINVELAQEQTKQLQEQLRQEEAKTLVDIEIAKRNNSVAEEEAKVYALSPEAYELERLQRLKDMLKDSDKIYFVPEGTDITLILGNNPTGTVLPSANSGE